MQRLRLHFCFLKSKKCYRRCGKKTTLRNIVVKSLHLISQHISIKWQHWVEQPTKKCPHKSDRLSHSVHRPSSKFCQLFISVCPSNIFNIYWQVLYFGKYWDIFLILGYILKIFQYFLASVLLGIYWEMIHSTPPLPAPQSISSR